MSDDPTTQSIRSEPASKDRDALLAETFVFLADTLVEDFDVVDLLYRLVEACVDLLEATAAGLLLLDARGQLRVVASSSEQAQLLEVFQVQSDEGPCLDSARSRTPVTVPDLWQAEERWPRFVEAAREVGFRAVHAVPLRLRVEAVGGLNLFHTDVGAMTAGDLRVAQALADAATIGILQQRAIHRGSILTEQLQTALNSRVVLEQAKGVLAESGQVDMQTAFEALRRHARDHNRKLADVASAVISGELSPRALLARSGRR
jgi:transcriptional regulator with GAF, ATPase, and Fis domain